MHLLMGSNPKKTEKASSSDILGAIMENLVNHDLPKEDAPPSTKEKIIEDKEGNNQEDDKQDTSPQLPQRFV